MYYPDPNSLALQVKYLAPLSSPLASGGVSSPNGVFFPLFTPFTPSYSSHFDIPCSQFLIRYSLLSPVFLPDISIFDV
jgi:hypothetical protein